MQAEIITQGTDGEPVKHTMELNRRQRRKIAAVVKQARKRAARARKLHAAGMVREAQEILGKRG